jgi:hypothetical protein
MIREGLLSTLVGLVGLVPTTSAEQRAIRVRLEHVADEPGHLYIGEPLDLVATTKNEGAEPVKGYLAASASSPTVEYYLQHGEATVRVDRPDPILARLKGSVCMGRTQAVLLPNRSLKTTARFLFETETSRLALDRPGEYEVFAVLRPFRHDPSFEVRSDAVRIVVSEPPDRFRSAFESLLKAGLPRLLDRADIALQDEAGLAQRAESYLADHAESPYGRHVRHALLHGLRGRVGTNEATEAERIVYERIETDELLRRSRSLPALAR